VSAVATPSSAQEIAELLRDTAGQSRAISIAGNHSKRLMGGPCLPADVTISTARLSRILQYEPNDLTISVEAGVRWSELERTLARNRQRIALDPPFAAEATVGGVVASNSSGPLRKQFGTARDLVIGMQFATLEGKLVRTGGMVVKNVAGLDMGKLLIGSFGTLAVITSVNFRLHPLPEDTRTFVLSFADSDAALTRCSALRESMLRPHTMDLIGPVFAARFGLRGYLLALQAGGSRRVLERYGRELAGSAILAGAEEQSFWKQVREAPAEFLKRQPAGLVLRIATPLSEMDRLLRLASGAAIARAGNGIAYIYLSGPGALASLSRAIKERGWTSVIEYAAPDFRGKGELWPLTPGGESAFAMMKSVKHMFDPQNLLNRSRLYGRI